MFSSDIILCVEDDDSYAEILAHVFKQAGFKHEMIRMNTAYEAQEYIEGKGRYADRALYPLPGLVLADLKMPRMNGVDLLKWLRNESSHPLLPFVVLTSSDDLKDIKVAYESGANSFLIKPPSVPDLTEMMHAVESYWMKQNTRP